MIAMSLSHPLHWCSQNTYCLPRLDFSDPTMCFSQRSILFSLHSKLLHTIHNNYTKDYHVCGWFDESSKLNTRYVYFNQQKLHNSQALIDTNRATDASDYHSYHLITATIIDSYYLLPEIVLSPGIASAISKQAFPSSCMEVSRASRRVG